MKVRKIVSAALPFFLAAALVFVCAFYPAEEETLPAKRIVLVWNVDTFEGGKGSRTSFLKNAARRVEAAREGVYFLVSSVTAEGAKHAFSQGDCPDILSFGIGLSEFAERSLPLPYSFAGGQIGGETRAYPWCAGGYYLFSMTEDFSAEGRVAISSGGSNLPQVAAALSGVGGEELPSLTAYQAFLRGEYRYLLGTQRDICRFASRSVSVYSRALGGYSDLYQYISILSAKKREDCVAFLEELLSERTQAELGGIGMFPLPKGKAEQTVSVFLSDEGREALLAAVRGGKNPEKFLKRI